MSPVLADGFSTTEPPGRSPVNFLTKYFFHCICIRVGRKLENIDKQKQHREYSHLCHPDVTTTNTLVFIISDLFIYIYIYIYTLFFFFGIIWCILFFFLLLCHVAYRILVPQPGIELRPLTVKAQSPNYWIAREFLMHSFLTNLLI